MTSAGRELEVLTELVQRSARDSEARPPGELRAIERAWRRRRQNRALGAVVGTALAAGVAVFVALSWHAATPLTFAIEGNVTWADHQLDVHEGENARLSFSDGTRFALAGGTRAGIAQVDGRGARVRLGSGRAHAAVVHKPAARWSVEAGPFVVRVIGTVFDLDWSASARVLEVALIEGEVKVEGPLPQLPIAVRAGQRLVLSAADGQLRVSPLAPTAPPVVAGAPVPASAAAADALVARPAVSPLPVPMPAPPGVARGPQVSRLSLPVRRANLAPPSLVLATVPLARGSEVSAPPTLAPPVAPEAVVPAQPAPAKPWDSRVAAGEFQAVLDEALAAGIEPTCATRSSDELAGLGDAARYLGRRDVAARALLAQRRRFPASENARRAAFHLGALAEERGGIADAIRWYDEYLAAAPDGSYAAEALGRKMLAIERRDGLGAARTLAAGYRERFPQGAYLVHALRILQAR
jgi:hypothetical protein